MKTLYRAADQSTARQGACFTSSQADAEAYLDNPGFGGATLYSVEIDPRFRLECLGRRNGLQELAEDLFETLGGDHESADDLRQSWVDAGLTRVFQVIENRPAVKRAVAASYDWLVYEDDYPEGCETWMYLGDGEIEMEEAE